MEQLSLLKVLIFALTLYRAQGGDDTCGDWDTIGDSCYKIVPDFMNFKEAKDYCATVDASVVVLESLKESDDVTNYAIQNKVSDWWIGITNVGSGYTWVNENNGQALAFTDWREGEPNNGNGKWEEECVVGMFRNETGWTDVNCDWPMYVICEKSLQTA